MNVREIITMYLKDNGYDGLFSDGECACALGVLFPCCHDMDIVAECEAGYRVPAEPGDEDEDWCIQAEKPASACVADCGEDEMGPCSGTPTCPDFRV